MKAQWVRKGKGNDNTVLVLESDSSGKWNTSKEGTTVGVVVTLTCAVVEQLEYIQSMPFLATRGYNDWVASSTVSLKASEGECPRSRSTAYCAANRPWMAPEVVEGGRTERIQRMSTVYRVNEREIRNGAAQTDYYTKTPPATPTPPTHPSARRALP